MPSTHEDHGERAPRADLRRRRTRWLAWPLALAAPAHAASPLCPTAGTRTTNTASATGTYDLTIKFEGVIAFAPRERQGAADKPDGTYKDVVALIPRTDRGDTPEKVFGPSQVPAAYWGQWGPYPAHHPLVRVRARHFAGRLPDVCQPPDRGDCGDTWVYLSLAADDPVRPPSHDENPQYAAYDVSIETCAPEAPVTLQGFQNVPRLLDSAPTPADAGAPMTAAKPCDSCLDFPLVPGAACAPLAPGDYARADGVPLAARVRLRHGETLSAVHLLPAEFAWAAHSGCEAACDRPRMASCDPLPGKDVPLPPGSAPFEVARHVVATRRLPVDAPVTLTLRRMKDGCLHRSYLLRPPAPGESLEVEVLNLPAEGALDLPTDVEPDPRIKHFNLFYLLAGAPLNGAPPAQRRFYFPHVHGSQRQDGRPWCSNARFDPQ